MAAFFMDCILLFHILPLAKSKKIPTGNLLKIKQKSLIFIAQGLKKLISINKPIFCHEED
jgi:hypothetical protein